MPARLVLRHSRHSADPDRAVRLYRRLHGAEFLREPTNPGRIFRASYFQETESHGRASDQGSRASRLPIMYQTTLSGQAALPASEALDKRQMQLAGEGTSSATRGG